MDHLVLTVIPPDQPGLVEKLAQCVADHGGNWLESSMARPLEIAASARWGGRDRRPAGRLAALRAEA